MLVEKAALAMLTSLGSREVFFNTSTALANNAWCAARVVAGDAMGSTGTAPASCCACTSTRCTLARSEAPVTRLRTPLTDVVNSFS